MKKTKLVSILSPVKNESRHIDKAIESVLSQSYKNIEMILVDDGSTDETLKKIKKYAKKDSRIKYIMNNKKGKTSAYNLAFEYARGELFVYFAGDDILPVDSIKNRVFYIENKSVAYGQLMTFSNDIKFDKKKKPRFTNKGVRSGGTIIFTKKIAKYIFPIPEDLPNEDTWTDLCVRYLTNGFTHIPIVVLDYRIHEKNSHNRYMDFATINTFFSKRYKVYSLFLKKYRKILKKEDKDELLALIQVETLRYTGRWVDILMIKKLSFSTKIRSVFNSNSFFYKFKLFLSFI